MEPLKTELKPGESVWCRLQSPQPGGYLVTLTPSGIQGFLPSHDAIDINRVVPATFVCMNGDQALLTYAFILGTTARVQVSTASEQENAFAVWADSYPNFNRLRRAVDLVMPPISAAPILLKLAAKTSGEFFEKLEEAAFTGCVKILCDEKLSRAAVIFSEGRAVGCVYTTKLISDPYPFLTGLKKMLEDLSDADADLEMYDLPAAIVLSMSALFLGYIDHRDSELDNTKYLEKMLEHVVKNKGTACMSILDESDSPCALGFICNGAFAGSYSIFEKVFSEETSFLKQLIEKNANSVLRLYILPTAMTTDSVRFGYSLTSEQFMPEEPSAF